MPTGKVVVITGATAGIGRALARRFARDGANIALLARGPVKLEATAKEVQELGGNPLPIEVDMADAAAVDAAAAQIEQELGPIDIWINNAAVDMFGRIEEVTPEEIQRLTDVTYHGAVWGTKAALRLMRQRGRGKIVQVGSGAAYHPLPLQVPYSAAKHALRAFTDGLRIELRHDKVKGVELTMVHPSAINTPLYTWARNHMPRKPKPARPVYEPELTAEIIYWAAHARRQNVLLGWGTVGLVYADKLVPLLLDLALARWGFKIQQTSEPAEPDAPNNLFDPVDEDLGARGEFQDIARDRAPLVRLVAYMGETGLRIATVLGTILGDDE